MASNLIKSGAVFALFCFWTTAQAVVLDWSSVTWTPGSLTNSYAYQHIGIYNLDFTVVPEIHPALSALVVCLLATALTIRQRRKIAAAWLKDR